jgi:hypothetical protein
VEGTAGCRWHDGGQEREREGNVCINEKRWKKIVAAISDGKKR